MNTPDDTNVANFFKDDSIANGYNGGHAVTGSPAFDSNQNYVTDVGAYTLATSPYGTYDQSGNVAEWTEAAGSSTRVTRGGAWPFFEIGIMYAGFRSLNDAAQFRRPFLGFRVASRIPEPSKMLSGALASVGLLLLKRRY